MDNLLNLFKQEAERLVQHLREDLSSLRTGRASPALLDGLIVEAYQGQSRLKITELASISADSPQSLSIFPFDASTIKDIEKAILKSPLGISPAVQGNRIFIKLPPLSQEQRQKMLKVINQKIEEKRGILRNERDNIRKKIKIQFEAKEISEDNKFYLEKEIDKITQKYNEFIQEIKSKKDKEVMEI